MPKILDVIAHSINNDMQRYSNISHNIANVNTTGFKAIDLVNSTAKPGQIEASLEARLNMVNGTLKKTERSFDFAIEGNGFFTIEAADGQQYLTRNGSFSLDENSNLVTQSGHMVIGQQGPIQLSEKTISFNNNGNILSDGQVINSFKLSFSEAPSSMEYMGASMYKPAASEELKEMTDIQIKQGFVEAANISASTQMIELIQISRHMQSNQKAILAYDHILNSGINTLGQR